MLPHVPGVQMTDMPEDSLNLEEKDKIEADKENPDDRISSLCPRLSLTPSLIYDRTVV